MALPLAHLNEGAILVVDMLFGLAIARDKEHLKKRKEKGEEKLRRENWQEIAGTREQTTVTTE
jgi:hypothetical protein